MFPAAKLHTIRHESSVEVFYFQVVKAIHSITYLNEAVSTWIQDLPTPSSPEYTATVILKNTHQLGQIQHYTHTRVPSGARYRTKSSKLYQLETFQFLTESTLKFSKGSH